MGARMEYSFDELRHLMREELCDLSQRLERSLVHYDGDSLRHSRLWRGARSNLDTAPGSWRRKHGEA